MSDYETFEGATHRQKDTGSPVKAVKWAKDGDHKMVERYPIDGRVFKGLLICGPKQKAALRFGDWVLEDEKGRLYVVPSAQFDSLYVAV